MTRDEAGAGAADFDSFVALVQGRVRRALAAVAGAEAARVATSDALVHAWRDWGRVSAMANPAGYVYTVARSRLRSDRGTEEALTGDLAGRDGEPDLEPRLVPLLAALPERQRVAVYLIHGCAWTTPEVADLLGVSISTARNHADRGLARLRRELKVADHGES